MLVVGFILPNVYVGRSCLLLWVEGIMLLPGVAMVDYC
jgi:hypothetical protein